ncbi:MAG: M23 family metallopeptidase [Coriobacteriales bacterium]|nr:M23 family metallopeptidase [Coriobacteriales bacterium]
MNTIFFQNAKSIKLLASGKISNTCTSSQAYRNFIFLMFSVLLFLLFFLSCAPIVNIAYASVWPIPNSQQVASLGFGATYEKDGVNYKHCGVDVAVNAGSKILAPAGGEVTFCGLVPSGDSAFNGGGEGETMLAASIRLNSGLVLTLMPFSDLNLESGQSVSEGQYIGTLAANGDKSSYSSHLHMGLRDNKKYIDPFTLFGLSSVSTVVEEAKLSEEATLLPTYVSPQVNDTIVVPGSSSELEFGEDLMLEPITSKQLEYIDNKSKSSSIFNDFANILSYIFDCCILQASNLHLSLVETFENLHIPSFCVYIVYVIFASLILGLIFFIAYLNRNRLVGSMNKIVGLFSKKVKESGNII